MIVVVGFAPLCGLLRGAAKRSSSAFLFVLLIVDFIDLSSSEVSAHRGLDFDDQAVLVPRRRLKGLREGDVSELVARVLTAVSHAC